MGFSVYVTRKIPEIGLRILKDFCDIVDIYPDEETAVPREVLINEIKKGRDAVLCLLTDKIDREILEIAKDSGVKIFANYAVGYDNIDVKSATELGIMVTNTPGVLTDTTAELAWALLFAIARRIVEADKFTRAGKFKIWSPTLLLGTDLKGKTLGIIGAGRIGTAMALKSKGFEMKVLYYDVRKNEILEKELGAKRVDLETLLKESDFISIHTPLTKETYHLIDEKELKMMKKTAYLINTSRGAVINEKALARALKEGWIKGAALDVYEFEPKITPELLELDNVVLAPHIGSATEETRGKMAEMAATNIVKALKGEVPPNLVNPEVLKK